MSNHHSRLGQVLINKGLIDRTQLDAAIQTQIGCNKRLGEVLIEQGVLSERQLRKALRKQHNLRLAAALVAALMSPFQTASADIQRLLSPHDISQQALPQGLQPLSSREMSNVSAQGLDEVLQGLLMQAEGGEGLATVGHLAKLAMPVLDSLEAETSAKDVRYHTDQLTSQLNPDGSLEVRLPSSIGELRFDNIRVAGASRSQSFGSLSLQDIDLSQASLRISLRR